MIALKEANYLGRVEHFRAYKGIIASVTSYPDQSYAENLHYHDTLHMSLVLKGGNLEKRKQHTIERFPGKVTFYDPGEPHRSTHTLTGSRHVNLELRSGLIEQYDIKLNAAMLTSQKASEAQFLMLQVYKALLLADSESLLDVEAITLQLLYLSVQQNRVKTKPSWVDRVDELLQDCWNERLTLHDLAKVAQLHPVNLSAWFSRYFGCTIGEYRRKLKVEKALPIIANTSLTLTVIANQCDFSDQSHFIRTFKQLTGWTPKAYRQMMNG
jgi:AraC family transcriptional regulator